MSAAELYVYEDWYGALVEECKATITERLYRSRQEIIEGWHEVGQRIANDHNYQKHARGNQDLRRKLAGDLGTHLSDLYAAIQFYEKYPELSAFAETCKEGKNISWNKVKREYLPAPLDKEPEVSENLTSMLEKHRDTLCSQLEEISAAAGELPEVQRLRAAFVNYYSPALAEALHAAKQG